MAQFYAEIQGNRGEATRMGTKNSGIRGHIRGWNVGVRIEGSHGDRDTFDVYATSGSSGRSGAGFLGTVTLDDDGHVIFTGRLADE